MRIPILICAWALAMAPAVALAQSAAGEDSGGRIVGGTPVGNHAAPWQAELFSTHEYTDKEIAADRRMQRVDPGNADFIDPKRLYDAHHICGGALIAPGWVLTAAHCINAVPKGEGIPYFKANRMIRLGTNTISDGSGAAYHVLDAIKHPFYDRKTGINDIALIRIADTPVSGTTAPGDIAAIRLFGRLASDPPRFNTSTLFTVTGWGWTGARTVDTQRLHDTRGNVQRASPQLMQVDLNYVPPIPCRASRADYKDKVAPSVICAGAAQGGHDSCQGDSGGPMTLVLPVGDPADEKSESVLVGVVSGGDGCAQPKTPGLYTKVSSFLTWIDGTMKLAEAR